MSAWFAGGVDRQTLVAGMGEHSGRLIEEVKKRCHPEAVEHEATGQRTKFQRVDDVYRLKVGVAEETSVFSTSR